MPSPGDGLGVSAPLGRSAGISSGGSGVASAGSGVGLGGCLSSSVLTESEGSLSSRRNELSARSVYSSPGGATCAPAAMYIKPNRAASTMSVVRRLTALLRFLFPMLSALLFKAFFSQSICDRVAAPSPPPKRRDDADFSLFGIGRFILRPRPLHVFCRAPARARHRRRAPAGSPTRAS